MTGSAFVLPRFRHCGMLQGKREVRPHKHAEPQIIVSCSGEAVVEVDGRRKVLEDGVVIVVPPGAQHGLTTHKESLVYHVRFTSGSQLFDLSLRTIRFGDDACIRRWLEDLYYLREAMGETGTGQADGVLFALLSRILRKEVVQNAPPMHRALRMAILLMERDISAPLTTKQIAKEAAVSVSYLTSLFREHLGCGPMQHLHALRMSLAERQLHDPYLSIKEIGYQSGYTDPNYFARVFRKRFGKTPSQYRETAMALQ